MGLFRHLLREAKGGILGWSIGLGALIVVIALSFPAIEGQDDFDELWEDYQDSLGSLFGDCPTLTEYACYMDTQIISILPVLVGIFAITHAARLLAGAEESGRLDVLLSTPVSRARLAWTHVLVLVAAQAILAAAIGLLMSLSALALGETEHVGASLLIGFNAMPAALVVGMLTYFVSAVAHRRLTPILVGTVFLIGSYFLGGLAPLSDTLDPLKWLSITHLYQQSQPLRDGLDPVYYVALLPVAAAFATAAWLWFERKDLTG